MGDWDIMEIRVRKLVKELIEPTILRVVETQEEVNSLKQNMARQALKIDETSILTANTNSRLETLDS